MHNICLFRCQLVLTNNLELTRFYDIQATMLLYRQHVNKRNIRLQYPTLFNILAGTG